MKFEVRRSGRRNWLTAAAVFLLLSAIACAPLVRLDAGGEEQLNETAILIEEVKAFGKTLGIEPTAALSRTAATDGALSMLWFWIQKAGTLAVRASIDIRMAIGFNAAKERVPLEKVYRVDGYSVYYRQGNEYADSRSAATPSFAAQGIVRRVNVILHEDLHGDVNFDLPWDIEEAVVTPLGSLAAVAYFKHKDDVENLEKAQAALNEGKQLSRDLNEIARRAEEIFHNTPVEEAKHKVLGLLAFYPSYRSVFQRQIAGQHPPTVLEAKLSHDIAYLRYFDAIAALAEKSVSLKTLIGELKKLPRDATPDVTEAFLKSLDAPLSRKIN